MRVKAVQFVPLGRPPMENEFFVDGDGCAIHRLGLDDKDYAGFVAHERREVEVEVPDPVPEWIAKTERTVFGCSCPCREGCRCWSEERIMQHYAAAYRAHVEERAKAAAERYGRSPTTGRGVIEECIREVFLA